MKSTNVLSICLLFVGLIICPDILALNNSLTILKNTQKVSERVYLLNNKKSTKSDTSNTREQLTSRIQLSNSGPSQAESSGYSTSSTDNLVNKFTGDFSYSIPLMNVEGYPIAINYNSNVGMHSEASWVGLGWDLNLGAVSRQMRGIPDEFNGDDRITRTHKVLENNVRGQLDKDQNHDVYGKKNGAYAGASFGVGIGGSESNTHISPSLTLSVLEGKYYSNYLGNASTFDFDLAFRFRLALDEDSDGDPAYLPYMPALSLGYSKDTKRGSNLNSSFSLSRMKQNGNGKIRGVNVGYGRSMNSRQGLINQSWSTSVSSTRMSGFGESELSNQRSFSGSSTLSFGTMTSIPKVQVGTYTTTMQKMRKFGARADFTKTFSVYAGYLREKHNSSTEFIYEKGSTNPAASFEFYQPAFGYLHSGKRDNFLEEVDEYPVMDFDRSNDHGFSENMQNLPFSYQTYDVFNVGNAFYSAQFRAHRTDYGTFYDPTVSEYTNRSVPEYTEPIPNEVPQKLKDKLSTTGSVSVKDFHIGGAYENRASQTNAAFAGGDMIGVDIGFGVGNYEGESNSGEWSNDFKFISQEQSSNFDSTVFFKAIGENTPTDMTAWEQMGGNTPVAFDIHESDKDAFELQNSSNSNFNNVNVRPHRANHFALLTANELLDQDIEFYDQNRYCANSTPRKIGRTSGFRRQNHLSQINSTSPEGMYMEYGIPVYSISNQEVSFSAQPISTNGSLIAYTSNDASVQNKNGRSHFYDKTVMPSYAHSFLLSSIKSSDYIDRTGNGPTIDDVGTYIKFNYTKITPDSNPYKWRFPVSQNNTKMEAFAVKGFEGSELDDVASYSYGEKELWYAKSIESKNYIAFFYISGRIDGYPVQNENGFLDLSSTPTQKLDSIVLYLREEYINSGCTSKNEAFNTKATPLQKVIFDYDYSLCDNAPNNRFANQGVSPDLRGKLTLKEIRVLSYQSEEMGLSVYSFEYHNVGSFSYTNVDSWGEYKVQNPDMPNAQFPYTEQNINEAGSKAKGWKMNAINLPSGGRIEVDYEADNYGFVQDQRAMTNLSIQGLTNVIEFIDIQANGSWDGQSGKYSEFTADFSTAGSGIANQWKQYNLNKKTPFYKDDKVYRDFVPNNIIIFKLEKSISGGASKSYADNLVASQYFDKSYGSSNGGGQDFIDKLHFRIKVNVKTGVNEYVTGFANIHPGMNNSLGIFGTTYGLPNSDLKSFGAMPKTNGQYEYGYVVLENISSGDIDAPDKRSQKKSETEGFAIHPLQKIALDFVRSNLPDKIYGACVNCDGDIDKKLDRKALFGRDIYKYMLHSDKGYVANIYPQSSLIRLFDGDKNKIGSGARVSKIKFIDNWDEISNENSINEPRTTYTWKYTYEKSNGESYGVASMEPKSSYDEAPQYQWNTYTDYKKKFPDEQKFTPTPVAIDLYPNAVVGYSKVKVEFEGEKNYGYSLTDYYTAYDFPTRENYTNPQVNKPERLQSAFNPLNALFGYSFSVIALQQGYTVETNDFHGKIRQVRLFDSNNTQISRTTFNYVDIDSDNKVSTVNRRLEVEQKSIGIEYDIHADSRFIEHTTLFNLVGIELSALGTISAFLPIKVNISPYYSRAKTNTGFFTSTLIKHINRSAIVQSVETEYLNSYNSADNLLWDQYSGMVIVSSLKDEFNDPLFSVNHPAHWYHAEFREKSDQTGKELDVPSFGSGVATEPSVKNFLTPGDVILVGSTLMRVGSHFDVQYGEQFHLTNMDGTFSQLGGAGTDLSGVKILKSNRKNNLTEIMQSFVTKENPLTANQLLQLVFSQETISSSAKTYRNKYSFQCVEEQEFSDENGTLTPEPNHTNMVVETGRFVDAYKYGAKGDLVVDGVYAWQGSRDHDLSNHGIRTSGTISNFIPYYKMALDGLWYPINVTGHPNQSTIPANDDALRNWRKLSEPALFDQYSKPLESKDQIDVFSSIIYGYSDKFGLVPVAQAVNSPKQSIAFDGFEDYSYYETSNFPELEPHFSFKDQFQFSNLIGLTSDHRHSGLQSLYIKAGSTLKKDIEIGNHCTYDPDDDNSHLFTVDECMCIRPFEPEQGEYVTSVWVKNGANMKFKITFLGNTLPSDDQVGTTGILPNVAIPTIIKEFTPTGCEIDGWQRLEGTFEIPASYGFFTIEIINEGSETMYIDDLRIHPFLAGMTTTVYDPKTLLPLATHDGYNYTTFYNYDENLMLSRVKVETECGIRTISESEFGSYKTYKDN